MSVMEMSHRSTEYMDIANKARQDFIDLLKIPSDYKVLFLQGGATLQFSMVPMNFGAKSVADYVLSGSWSKKAINEASKIIDINIVASSESSNFNNVPNERSWSCSENAAYLHYVANETIQGNALHNPPTSNAPLISDMSSVILSEPIDVSKFSMIYAGAQKNIGPAGLTICIIKNDFLKQATQNCPACFSMQNMQKQTQCLILLLPLPGIYQEKFLRGSRIEEAWSLWERLTSSKQISYMILSINQIFIQTQFPGK